VPAVARAADGAGVDPSATFELLAGLGVVQALVEGGARVAGALLDADLVDRLVLYVAPTVLGAGGVATFAHAGPRTIAEAPRFRLTGVTQLADDIRVDYERNAVT
jgi:diaminohydroxyphosphoribosylaminopyrimidine deaminase/5-amino-6-(5-phosphoribosylamino)uracil reductase